jgi:hypothetical protein
MFVFLIFSLVRHLYTKRVYKHVQTYVGVYKHVQIHVGGYKHVQIHVGVYKHIQNTWVCTNMYR